MYRTLPFLLLLCLPALSQAQQQLEPLCHFDYNWVNGVWDVAQSGQYAFLARGREGVSIADVSDAAHPVIVAEYENEYFGEMRVVGDLMLAMNSEGIGLYHITDEPGLELISTLAPVDYCSQMDLDGQRAVFYGRSGNYPEFHTTLVLLDLSAPEEPVELARYEDLVEGCSDIRLQENRILVADAVPGMVWVDISDLDNPIVSEPYYDEHTNWSFGIDAFGDYAVLAAGMSGFQLIDLQTMQSVASLTEFTCAFQIHVSGDMAYMSYGEIDCPLVAIDLSDPLQPVARGIYEPVIDMENFVVKGDKAYCACFNGGLRITELSNPDDLHEIGWVNYSGEICDVARVGDYAITLEYLGLRTIDISDPTAPVLAGFLELDRAYDIEMLTTDVAVVKTYTSDNLITVDLSDPTAPSIISIGVSDQLPHNELTMWGGTVVISDRHVIHFIDVSDPAQITPLPNLACTSYYQHFAAYGDYLIHSNQGSDQYDVLVKHAGEILPLTSFDSEYSYQLRVVGDLLYTWDYDYLRLHDLSTLPEQPVIHEIELPGVSEYLTDIKGQDNLLFVTSIQDGSTSMSHIRVYDNTNPLQPVLLAEGATEGQVQEFSLDEDLLVMANVQDLCLYDVTQIEVSVATPAPGPEGFALLGCAPNPFNPSTTLSFTCPRAAEVRLAVYNLLGRCITTLADQEFAAGEHSITWEGRDTNSRPVASGSYFIVAEFPDGMRVSAVSLLK